MLQKNYKGGSIINYHPFYESGWNNLSIRNMKNKKMILGWLLCLLPFYSVFSQETHWQCDSRNFQYDMTVYAALQIDGIELEASTDYEVAVSVVKSVVAWLRSKP